MLGMANTKGCLSPGADADLVIFSETRSSTGGIELVVDEVWKLGMLVYRRAGADVPEPKTLITSRSIRYQS